MRDLKNLLELLMDPDYNRRYLIAKRTRTCVACGSGSLSLRDAYARMEHTVSALCQECQDRFLAAQSREEPSREQT